MIEVSPNPQSFAFREASVLPEVPREVASDRQ